MMQQPTSRPTSLPARGEGRDGREDYQVRTIRTSQFNSLPVAVFRNKSTGQTHAIIYETAYAARDDLERLQGMAHIEVIHVGDSAVHYETPAPRAKPCPPPELEYDRLVLALDVELELTDGCEPKRLTTLRKVVEEHMGECDDETLCSFAWEYTAAARAIKEAAEYGRGEFWSAGGRLQSVRRAYPLAGRSTQTQGEKATK